MAHDSIEYPQAQDDKAVYEFTANELQELQSHINKYPEKRSAVMPALWIAQRKYGWLSNGAIKLVADTLEMPFVQVYGVATFYTMYLKENVAKNLVEICTCYTCGECGGDSLYEHALKSINADEHGASPDKFVWVREAECLGACDTAPVVQINNEHYRYKVDKVVFDQIIADLRAGKPLEYEQVPLTPQ